ncbi:ribosome-binding protein 1-like isoform X3 [Danaus plexippus]|uniref:ribosome-binding protein 1-like isoform X3 n=1 Tax=Danaus plexippus TaxID=13037 RepID=UPI002AB2CB2D|nr:ribosome-binding protein 1-like isoform X3 [Danaus plexippus]
MELQALLVLCGVGVAGVAVVLLMGLFSASGTSYEEAIAQQRRATNELLALADNKNKSKKTNKKANKKLAKKEKREAAATGSEVEEATVESCAEDDNATPKPHVEFSPDVVVEHPAETPNIKIRKRGKDPKVKPILLNKEDPSCVSDPSAAATPVAEVANHFEEMHPKDEIELLQSTLEKVAEKKEDVVEKKESKTKQAKGKVTKNEPIKEEPANEQKNSSEAPQEQKKAKKVEKNPEVIEEVVPPLNAPQPSELTTEKLLKQVQVTTHTTTSPPKNKKKKAEQNVLAMIAGEGGGVAVSELVRVVREAALSRTEIQILTDALLNKHHDPLPQHSEWTEGPNDPMQKLKKQLADKEKALAYEIEASQALHAKLKELRAGLNAERARGAAAGRAAEAAASTARAELHTLQGRLQMILEDNQKLTQEKLVLQTKLNEENEAQRLQMEMHIQRLTKSKSDLVAQLEVLQAHATELEQQLQESQLACGKLEAQRQAAVRDLHLSEQDCRDLIIRHLNAEEYRKHIVHLEMLKGEAEIEKQEMSKEISSLKEQLSELESELAELKQLKASPAQNGLPNSITDEQKSAELAKVESVVESLRNELATAQKSSAEQKQQLATLQEQLDAYKDKNNELRIKNWKVMEALQNAEKSIKTEIKGQEIDEAIEKAQEMHFNEVANVLRKVYPVGAPNTNPSKEWLETFAENLKKELEDKETQKKQLSEMSTKIAQKENERKQLEVELQKKLQEKELVVKEIEENMRQQIQKKEKELQIKLQEKENEMQKRVVKEVRTERVEVRDDTRIKELETQNEQLQALVDKYKRIIDDTEGVLGRLQADVSREEQRWQNQLAEKQRQLDQLRSTTIMQMQSKIDALEAELQKLQTKNHSNFADAERITEERLMSGFCSKQESDVHNGPLQVRM